MIQQINRNDFESIESQDRQCIVKSNITNVDNVSISKHHHDDIVIIKAKKYIRARQKRESIFKNMDIFGEPAWDIIIDLFVASEECRLVSVSSLCIASNVPTTTALRWITILENLEIIIRTADPSDGRRSFLALSDSYRYKIGEFFAQHF